MLSVEELALLEAIRETGSLSRAAVRLGKAPSTVSHTARQLESRFDALLFDRRRYRLQLTPAGHLLAQEAARLVQDVSRLTQRVKQVAGGWEDRLWIVTDEILEFDTLLPVIRALTRQVKVPISIDTMKAGVARAALDAGASIVNDVAAAQDRAEMWRVVSKARAGYVCMHMRGTPQNMQDDPKYQDVVSEVEGFLRSRVAALKEAGIGEEQIVLDPGIGFGKTAEHNLQLLGAMRRFTKLGQPILLGVSRKSFLGRVSGTECDDRLSASLACACFAVEAGVQMLRVHDVAATVRAVRMTEAILSKRI